MADGRTFYYSDYNFKGRKVYRDDQHWACCSGTLPQVAADYRINTYFRDPSGVWVNLYIPSTLRWTQDGAQLALTQKSLYPFEEVVTFEITTSHKKDFAINFRIPAWASWRVDFRERSPRPAASNSWNFCSDSSRVAHW